MPVLPAQPAGAPAAVRPGAPAWTIGLWRRMRRLFWLKALGTTAFTWLFFIAYFHLLRHPAHAVTVMPLTALDHLVPFQPQWLAAYVSLWVYVGVAPGLQRNFTELLAYGAWISALCAAGLGLFYAWPTSVPPLTLAMTDAPGFTMLKGVDAAGNACPSMHVAVAFFSALWVEHQLRQEAAPGWLRGLNAGWFLAIAYSTLAVKQHVVLDVLAGALLGGGFAWASLRWGPGRRG